MQHSSVVMGLGPMNPEMSLEREPISHRCHAQLAAVRQFPQGMHRVAFLPLCSASHVLPWIVGTTSLLVAFFGATVGWVWGAKKIFVRSFRRRGVRCLGLMLQRGSQAAAGSVHTHGVQALPGHRVLPKAGAAC